MQIVVAVKFKKFSCPVILFISCFF